MELLGVVGSKWKTSKVVDVKLASSLIWSHGGDCCESDSKLEKLKFAEFVKIGARMELSKPWDRGGWNKGLERQQQN